MTLYNLSRTGKVREWSIEAQGDKVITTFGEQGGKMQTVTDTAYPVNVGKANEKSAEQVAQEMAARQILLKSRQGYSPTLGEPTEMCFEPLPASLRFYKPDNSLSGRLLKKLENGTAWLGRKRDGEAMPLAIGPSRQATMYSRTMLVEHDKEPDVLWLERFPQLQKALAVADLPPNTILLGEVVMDRNGADDFIHVGTVMKSLRERALATQNSAGWLSYYIWDIAFCDGVDMLKTVPFRQRLETIQGICEASPWLLPLDVHRPEDVFHEMSHSAFCASPTFDPNMSDNWNAAQAMAFYAKWEGWVVVDPDSTYGDKSYNFRGKTDRPGPFCGKLKPAMTDEFVAMWDPANGVGEYGSGKYQGLIGSVCLYQHNKAGELVFVSECGNGFTEEDLRRLSDPTLYPLVFEVKFDERSFMSQGDKTNALRFPRFLRERPDKMLQECINEEL